jgi:hypothetical protein
MGNSFPNSVPPRYFVVTVPERARHGPQCPWAPGRRSEISLEKKEAEKFRQHLIQTRTLSVQNSALVLDQGWFTNWKTPAKQLDADGFDTIERVPPQFSTIF